MTSDIRIGETLIVGDAGDLGAVHDAPGPLVGARGTSGLWLCLDTEDAWKPAALIDAINDLLAQCPFESVRVVATRALLASVAAADRDAAVVRPGRDKRHVVSFFDRRGAAHPIRVDEAIDAEGLVGGEIMQFVLPNYVNEMSLVEELAQAANAAGRPDIACRAFVQAFETNPFFAREPACRKSFELVALAAGDRVVPGIKRPALEVFDELAGKARLPALPEVSNGATIRVFAPGEARRDEPDAYPSVIPTPGRQVDAILVAFGGLLVQAQHRDVVPTAGELAVLSALIQESLQLSWTAMSKLDRMRTERAAFVRFGTTLSNAGAVKPFLPEAVVLVQSLRAGIPPQIALRKLDEEIHNFENA